MSLNQSGKTLLETLAIIGIIGILTVSGLQLYAKAMNTIKVNHLMEKVYLFANQIRNKEIENRSQRKAYDLPKVDETLSYGFSFDTESSTVRNGQIKVVVKGSFSTKFCKMLNKKLNDESNGKGLKSIEGCESNSPEASITFSFDSSFRPKKSAKKYSTEDYSKAQNEYSKNVNAGENCAMEGALTCRPLVCDVQNGWFEFDDAPGHCEKCPAGYYCE